MSVPEEIVYKMAKEQRTRQIKMEVQGNRGAGSGSPPSYRLKAAQDAEERR